MHQKGLRTLSILTAHLLSNGTDEPMIDDESML